VRASKRSLAGRPRLKRYGSANAPIINHAQRYGSCGMESRMGASTSAPKASVAATHRTMRCQSLLTASKYLSLTSAVTRNASTRVDTMESKNAAVYLPTDAKYMATTVWGIAAAHDTTTTLYMPWMPSSATALSMSSLSV